MRRIGLAVVLSLALVPLAGEAQQAARMPRIGYLVAAPATNPHFLEGFRQGLRDLGYVDGGNIVIEYRSADGQFERLPDVAGELVRLKLICSLARAHRRRWRPSKRPRQSRLSLLPLLMRLEAGLSPALRGRAAMSRA